VKSLKDLNNIIIPHFVFKDKYPLLTQKRADFQLFKMAIELINNKKHLTKEGLNQILSIKASINKGLSPVLMESFPDIIPVERPYVEGPENIDPNWIAGFTTGEGTFYVGIQQSKAYKTGYQVSLRYWLTQHSRDTLLMNSLKQFFNCGMVDESRSRDCSRFFVSKFSDIEEKIIPFFNKYPLLGVKISDFLDFVKVAELMKVKAHKTSEGLEGIIKIKNGMNSGRKYNKY
jgi:hypothetical protein